MLKTNREKLVIQQVLGVIAPPTLLVEGWNIGAYVTTWDGKPKIGIGIGGIKYNVDVGDPCFGWAESEYLEPGVSIEGIEEREAPQGPRPGGLAMALNKLSCVGNEVTVIGLEGVKGVVVGKIGYAGLPYHVLAHFPQQDLEKLKIGDKVSIKTEGVGLKIEGFDGHIHNMSPGFLDSLNVELEDGNLIIPVRKVIPAYVMGHGVGGEPAECGHWSIQSSPPELVEKEGLLDLRIGDLVAIKDVLMTYGKGYYRGAMTVGIVITGASDIAGHGPAVFAIATSKNGKIKPVLDEEANISKYLGLKR